MTFPVEGELRARMSRTLSRVSIAAMALAGAVAFMAPATASAKPLTEVQLKAQNMERMIVAYKPGKRAAAKKAIKALGGKIVVDLDRDNAFAAEFKAGVAAKLKRNPAVAFVEVDAFRHVMGFRGPAPVSAQEHDPSVAQVEPYGIPMVQADQLSDSLTWNRRVCIIDSGIQADHEDLAGIPMDGINFSGSGEWYTDESSHGTHVAGTIAALDNDIGVIGVMPTGTVNLYISKVFDASGSAASSTIIQGVRGCMDADASVINMSLGGGRYSKLEEKVYAAAVARNILVIASAGNGGSTELNYPASYPGVMSVAAVDSEMAHAEFSQYNSEVEIAAPGVSVLSTVPIGSQIGATTTVDGVDYDVLPMAGSPYTSASGLLADFGIGDVVLPGAMTGMVCLIQRGSISFADKVSNCEASGGIGAIVYNNTDGALSGTLGETVTTIPSVGATMADGEAMLGQLGTTATVTVGPSDDQYAYYSGTSMAAPHATGVAALVWSYFPDCTSYAIRASLDNSAMDLGDAGRDDYFGYGLIQAKDAYDRIMAMGCGQ